MVDLLSEVVHLLTHLRLVHQTSIEDFVDLLRHIWQADILWAVFVFDYKVLYVLIWYVV